MITFGKMEVEGYASILDETFNWGIRGLNIIKAPNGTGKSKFINALVWGLYGKTLAGSVETWDSIKPKNHKGTKVIINFHKGTTEYKVTRCKDYEGKVNGAKGKNRLIIEEDGVELSGIDGKAEAKSELDNILGYSYDLFKNSIVFGQKLKRLVSESGPNKKKVLDEAFEMVYIPRANKLASDRLKVLEASLSVVQHKSELSRVKVDSLKAEISREQENIKRFESDKVKDIKVEKDYADTLRIKLSEFKATLPDKDSLLIKLEKLSSSIEKKRVKLKEYGNPAMDLALSSTKKSHSQNDCTKLSDKIKSLETSISNLPEECPNCGKTFTKKEKALELGRLNEKLKTLESEYTIINNTLTDLSSDIQTAKTNLTSAKTIEVHIDSLVLEKKELEKQLNFRKDIKNRISSTRELIKRSRKNIKAINSRTLNMNLEKLQEDLSWEEDVLSANEELLKLNQKEVDDYRWLISDPLSNSGLKAFIFDQMLDSINDRLDYYSKFSGIPVGFVIDMKSARKDLKTWISNPKGEFVPYEDLSGGQQQKVDIVTLFAIHDVVNGNKDCNLLVMDELFESLDKDNIELLTELIQDKANSKCLYLITHRYEFSPTNSNTIELQYIDGVTSIVE